MERATTFDSPAGRLVLVSNGYALTALRFAGRHAEAGPAGPRADDEDVAPFPQARRELEEYFAGRRTTFEVPLAPHGTAFQRRVWDALRRIPHGATTTYGKIAREIGAPNAVRAVGGAIGRNPLAIVVPCHRVIGADGTLTGYAAGIGRKRALLDFERARAPRRS